MKTLEERNELAARILRLGQVVIDVEASDLGMSLNFYPGRRGTSAGGRGVPPSWFACFVTGVPRAEEHARLMALNGSGPTPDDALLSMMDRLQKLALLRSERLAAAAREAREL